MKIVPMPPKAPAKPVTESARDRRPGAADRATTVRADRVELSSAAAAMLELAPVEVPPSTDRSRLDALRAAIRDGALKVNEEDLADSIVEEDLSWPSGGSDGVA